MQTMSYSSSDQWPQYYHHQNPYGQPSLITTPSTTPLENSSNLRSNSDGPRPTKRKTRSSKRAPTTIFNADVANFRALVQQLTGRPMEPREVVRSRKGPLHINFAKTNAGDEADVRPRVMPFGYTNNNSIIRQSVIVNEARNNGKGFVEHVDMTLSSSGQGSSRRRVADEYTAMNAVAFDDFDVDDLCLEELDRVANGNI